MASNDSKYDPKTDSTEWEVLEELTAMKSQLEDTQRRVSELSNQGQLEDTQRQVSELSNQGFNEGLNKQRDEYSGANFSTPAAGFRSSCVNKRENENFSTPRVGFRSGVPVQGVLKREVVPEKFNGTKWDNYITHFEACSCLNGWTEDEAGAWLAASLTGNAVQVLNYGSMGYRELRSRLERSFGSCARPENYVIEFRNRKRKTGETLPE